MAISLTKAGSVAQAVPTTDGLTSYAGTTTTRHQLTCGEDPPHVVIWSDATILNDYALTTTTTLWGGKERGSKGQGWRPWARAEFLGRGPPLHQLRGLGPGECCKFPAGLRVLGLFSHIFNTQGELSGQQDYGPLEKHIKHVNDKRALMCIAWS